MIGWCSVSVKKFKRGGWVRYEIGVESGNGERRPGGGRIGSLNNFRVELFFILFYFKCFSDRGSERLPVFEKLDDYPVFNVLGLLFDLDRSNTCRNVHRLTPILEKICSAERWCCQIGKSIVWRSYLRHFQKLRIYS